MTKEFTIDSGPRSAPVLPTFDGFPYLSTRIVRGMYHILLLPEDVEISTLMEMSRQQVRANNLQACLILGIQECIYFEPDGKESQSNTIPHGGIIINGKLKPGKQFSVSAELTKRTEKLQEFIEGRKYGGFMLGDLSKGGRPATPEEALLYSGLQENGVPKGLARCDSCQEWKGQCLDPSPNFQGMIMQVHCLCENDNVCARCGHTLYARKLNANLYDESDGQIWHVPGFCAFSHNCPDSDAEVSKDE